MMPPAKIFLDLGQNVALLLALGIVYSSISRRWKAGELAGQALSGVLFGVVAVVGMTVPLALMEGVVFDGRSVVISMAGVFGGPVTAALAAVIAGGYRLWLGGVGALTGIGVIASSAALGVAYCFLRRHRPGVIAPGYLFAFGVLNHAVMLAWMLTLPKPLAWQVLDSIAVPVMLLFPLATLLLGILLADLESRNKAAEDLRFSEQRFRDFSEAASDWFWEMGPDLRLSYLSDRFAEITGFEGDVLVGMRRDEISSDDRTGEDWQRHLADLEARRPFRDFRYHVRDLDGAVKLVSVSGKPLFDENGAFLGYRGTGTDLTAEMQAEARAARSQQQLIDALETSPDAFVLYDTDDRVVLCNRRYKEFFFPGEEHIARAGTPFATLARAFAHSGRVDLGGKDPDAWLAERLQRHLNPGPAFEHQLADGHWVLAHERRTGDGRTISVFTDITDLRQREVELEAAKEQAELANRAKSQFLANISHELRTPLNAILGFSEMIEREIFGPVGNDAYREYAKDIHDSGTHLLRVISDILDLSKIEAGKFSLEEEPIEVAKAVAVSVRLLRERADTGEVTLDIDIAPDLPELWADDRAVKQILLNLLSNAVKFTPAGGRVAVRAGLEDARGDLYLDVIDSGIGITEEDLGKVLAPFGQVDGDLNRKYEGTGLGLPIAKRLVELHGGSLGIESAPGAGTTVRVVFPRERLSSTPGRRPRIATAASL